MFDSLGRNGRSSDRTLWNTDVHLASKFQGGGRRLKRSFCLKEIAKCYSRDQSGVNGEVESVDPRVHVNQRLETQGSTSKIPMVMSDIERFFGCESTGI
jgi:hypothetical protein